VYGQDQTLTIKALEQDDVLGNTTGLYMKITIHAQALLIGFVKHCQMNGRGVLHRQQDKRYWKSIR